MASDDLPARDTPCFTAGVTTFLLVVNQVSTTFEASHRLVHRAVLMPAPSQRGWFQNPHKSFRRSESENQIMILQVDLACAKPADFKKPVASHEGHSGADKTIMLAGREVIAENLGNGCGPVYRFQFRRIFERNETCRNERWATVFSNQLSDRLERPRKPQIVAVQKCEVFAASMFGAFVTRCARSGVRLCNYSYPVVDL